MAVYTDVSDEELEAFIASYAIGALTSFKGIAEGVENSNYLVHTESGRYILTLYEKRVRAEDLPYFLALMEHLAARGITCPLPVRDRDGHTLKKLAGRPAALITFLEGLWVRRPRHRALRRARPSARTVPSRRHGLSHATEKRSVATRLADAVRLDRQRRGHGQNGACGRDREGAALSRAALDRRSAARRDPRRSVPGQCVLSRRQGVGVDRFLFRLQRHAGLRRRGLSQCLVLRDRRQLQCHQGAGAARGL